MPKLMQMLVLPGKYHTKLGNWCLSMHQVPWCWNMRGTRGCGELNATNLVVEILGATGRRPEDGIRNIVHLTTSQQRIT